jgi:hypothetical protein
VGLWDLRGSHGVLRRPPLGVEPPAFFVFDVKGGAYDLVATRICLDLLAVGRLLLLAGNRP